MKPFGKGLVLGLLVVAILVIAAISGPQPVDPYLQGLDEWWLSHDAEDRRQACHLATQFGAEYTAETLALQWGEDQDHYVMALNRHC